MTAVLKTLQHLVEPHQSKKMKGSRELSVGIKGRITVSFMSSRAEKLEDMVKAHYSFISKEKKGD